MGGDAPGGPNQPPVSDAGTDQAAVSETTVTLDGSGSTDPDGTITTYSWAQTQGPAVPLNNADTAAASFTAPTVSSVTVLQFELTVADDQSATSTDQVQVTVHPPGTDIIPPVTTLTQTKRRVKGVTFYDITLAANEPATTFFKVTGQGTVIAGGTNTTDEQVYSGLITIQLDKKGTVNFEYYSIDTANNQETTQAEVLK